MTDHRLRATDGPCETCGHDGDRHDPCPYNAERATWCLECRSAWDECPTCGADYHPQDSLHPFLGRSVETAWQSIIRRYAVERGFAVKR